VKANNKKRARLEAIRHLLSQFEYEGKDRAAVSLTPDPNVVARFHRRIRIID
jgi:polyphosphate kinase